MSDKQSMNLSTSAVKSLYKAKRRRLNVDNWKDNKRKILKQSGREYTSRDGTKRLAKQPPKSVMEKRCK